VHTAYRPIHNAAMGVIPPLPSGETNEALIEMAIAASACTACGLAERRRNVAFGEGNSRSPLVLVGEGPGDTEDALGRPFVGKAGQLLERALGEAGLSRNDVYIANTVKCRACDWVNGRPINRPPTDIETMACRRWLEPQLAAIDPRVILCIGAPSARNLIKRDFKITVERGKFFSSNLAKTVLATLHPAYILRNQHGGSDGGYSLLVADIVKAWEAAIRLRDGRTRQESTVPTESQPSLFEV